MNPNLPPYMLSWNYIFLARHVSLRFSCLSLLFSRSNFRHMLTSSDTNTYSRIAFDGLLALPSSFLSLNLKDSSSLCPRVSACRYYHFMDSNYNQCNIVSFPRLDYTHNLMSDYYRQFLSSTLMRKDEIRKVGQLLNGLFDSPDSFEFRVPVDYLGHGLLDYPLIVKKPMDLSTVKRNLLNGQYQTVEECLADVQLIWDNCKLYNTQDNWIKLADKLEKLTKKMIKNYVPFVQIDATDKRKGPKKEIIIKKPVPKIAQLEPKDYLELNNAIEVPAIEVPAETEFSIKRKEFLMYVHLCSNEQVGVLFLLIHKHNPEAIEYDSLGNANINMEMLSDGLLARLREQYDMWGVGYVQPKRK